MTASQTAIPAKRSQSMTGPIAVVAAGLMVAVIGVAITARPFAAPASVTSGTTPLTMGHDEARPNFNLAAPLTINHDEARPFHVIRTPHKHIPTQQHVPSYYRVLPTYPAAQPTPASKHFRGQ